MRARAVVTFSRELKALMRVMGPPHQSRHTDPT